MTIACSITNSHLLITLCHRPRKHQLSDFFNTNEILQQQAAKPLARLVRLGECQLDLRLNK